MKYYVTENRNLKVWTEKPEPKLFEVRVTGGNFWEYDGWEHNKALQAWQDALDKQPEILTSPELKEQLTPGQVKAAGKDFKWHLKRQDGDFIKIAVPLDTATEEKNLREAEVEAVKRYPKRYKNNAFRRTAFKEGVEWAKKECFVIEKTSYDEWLDQDDDPTILLNELQQLRDWKESAISVMPDYQALGKEMNVPLGESVHDKILPYIRKLKALATDKFTRQDMEGGGVKKVCYCGSLRVAMDAFKKAEYEAVLRGEIALLPCCMFVDIQREYGAESDYKQKADELHKRKIDICDEVFVLNVGGYIGESTRSEIAYAESIAKPVKYLEPLPNSLTNT